jgi:hypothetical protein
MVTPKKSGLGHSIIGHKPNHQDTLAPMLVSWWYGIQLLTGSPYLLIYITTATYTLSHQIPAST